MGQKSRGSTSHRAPGLPRLVSRGSGAAALTQGCAVLARAAMSATVLGTQGPRPLGAALGPGGAAALAAGSHSAHGGGRAVVAGGTALSGCSQRECGTQGPLSLGPSPHLARRFLWEGQGHCPEEQVTGTLWPPCSLERKLAFSGDFQPDGLIEDPERERGRHRGATATSVPHPQTPPRRREQQRQGRRRARPPPPPECQNPGQEPTTATPSPEPALARPLPLRALAFLPGKGEAAVVPPHGAHEAAAGRLVTPESLLRARAPRVGALRWRPCSDVSGKQGCFLQVPGQLSQGREEHRGGVGWGMVTCCGPAPGRLPGHLPCPWPHQHIYVTSAEPGQCGHAPRRPTAAVTPGLEGHRSQPSCPCSDSCWPMGAGCALTRGPDPC
nr:uncharacterized protein LOC127485846 [Oryctolagus cuniculus]XP_051685237.1 uncharacterized protein LOC127485846 [Oryctolagus cuniculus]